MPYYFFLLLALFFSGCASQKEYLRANFHQYPEVKLLSVPFIAQEKYFCAPATLAMVANNLGHKTSPNQLAQMLYSPLSKGTFQNDLLATTRRLGLIAVPVNSFEEIVQSLNEDIPILIFQNLGLSWIPKWHYALIVGYDFPQENIILHSGEYENFPLKIRTFEKTWKRVENWGLVIVNPGTIPNFLAEEDMVKATAGLELGVHPQQIQLKLAKISYEAILKKWPKSLGALVGAGNISYQLNDYKNSAKFYEKATSSHPESFGAWYNYAMLLIETKKFKKAHWAADKALENAEPLLKEAYREKLEKTFAEAKQPSHH